MTTIRRMLKQPWFYILAILIVIGVTFAVNRHHAAAPASTQTGATSSKNSNGAKTTSATAKSFNKKQYSISDPASIWTVVNKRRPLNPQTYAPDVAAPNVPLRLNASNGEMHLAKAAIPAFEQMFAGAKAAGLNLMLASGYRSYGLQVSVYNAEVKNYGQAKADSESARPGTSEHQTGLAADVEPASRKCEVTDCFGDTPEGKWLAANSYKYGFIIRYVPGKESVTGYRPEPWHVRYVGTALAAEMHNTGIQTLEEFFGLPAAPDYQ